MWSLLVSCFAFLPLATTLLVPSDNAISRRQGHIPASRNYLAVYVQTLHTPNDKPLSLHPILTEFTGVTHVIIAGLHLNSPTNITLNGYAPSHANYAQLWSDVEKLQYRGVKVMAMVGGASEGDWTGLAGNNATVTSTYLSHSIKTTTDIHSSDLTTEPSATTLLKPTTLTVSILM